MRGMKLDKRRRVCLSRALPQGSVVCRLVFVNQTFDRNIGKHRVPAEEYQGLPESSHASVAVDERVDELEFVVKRERPHQGVQRCIPQPLKQVSHEQRDSVCGRRHSE